MAEKKHKKKINKTMMKKIRKLNNKTLLQTAQVYKMENRVNSSSSFQRDYDTVLMEVKRRGLMK